MNAQNIVQTLDFFIPTFDENKSLSLNLLQAENNKVWKCFYNKKMQFIKRHEKHIYASYLSGLERLHFERDRFPSLLEIRERLKPIGWDVIAVPGFIPGREYANYLLNRVFPIASNVRTLKHFMHAMVPDSIHDIWGHLPLLFDSEYTHFLLTIAEAISNTKVGQRELAIYNARNELGSLEESGREISKIAQAREELMRLEKEEHANPEHFTRMSRFFLWTIEFGLLGSRNQPKMIGAALLSSFEDGLQVVRKTINFESLTKNTVYAEINFTEPQSQLFLAENIQQYLAVLNECSSKETD